jgi:hypothetical protein
MTSDKDHGKCATGNLIGVVGSGGIVIVDTKGEG